MPPSTTSRGLLLLPGKNSTARSIQESLRTIERQSLSPSHPFKFAVRRQAAQSIPNGAETAILYDTIDRDPNNSYNGNTGVYTVRQAGWWSFTACITWNQATNPMTNIWIDLLVGGVAVRRGAQQTGSITGTPSIPLATQLELNAGDQVSVGVTQASSPAQAQNTWANTGGFNYFEGHFQSYPVR